ncbi:Uncharacterized protein dnm_021510 [Desulfonema magnum]|uniref:Uncharacterized protein n=1 Tax=Desulfonema magnum TaxID=45655 RepID=A0A975BIS0_9BACT|nr:Uncharacterized protein dnm_021510 [Desulfonema magnum]
MVNDFQAPDVIIFYIKNSLNFSMLNTQTLNLLNCRASL